MWFLHVCQAGVRMLPSLQDENDSSPWASSSPPMLPLHLPPLQAAASRHVAFARGLYLSRRSLSLEASQPLPGSPRPFTAHPHGASPQPQEHLLSERGAPHPILLILILTDLALSKPNYVKPSEKQYESKHKRHRSTLTKGFFLRKLKY